MRLRPILRPLLSEVARRRAAIHAAFGAAIADARIALLWSDLSQHNGKFVPNRVTGATPSSNLLALPTGPIMNESGGSSLAKTNYHVTWTDADGTSYATQLVTDAVNETFFLYRTTTCPAIPNGVYGMRFRARASSGAAAATLNFGLSSGYANGNCQDLDWTQAANTAATTFSTEFTYAGAGDIAIRIAEAAKDILIDRIQIYPGGLAAIPDWSDEVLDGGRRAFCYPSAFAQDAHGNWDLTVNSGGALALEPGLADKAYTALTLMHAGSLDDLDAAGGLTACYLLAVPTSTRLGTSLTTGPHVGFETNNPPYEGRAKWAPQSLRAETGEACLDAGIVVLGNALDASGRIAYFNEVPQKVDATAWAGITTPRWLIGSGSTTQRAHIDVGESVGKHAVSAIWDRKIEPEEWERKARAVRQYLATRGGAAVLDYHVLDGDSNYTAATGDFGQLMTAHDWLAPGRNMLLVNPSVGGTGIAEMWGSNPATIDAGGRFMATVRQMLLAVARSGALAVWWPGNGTNDFTEISGAPAWGTTVYNATCQALWETALALHPNVRIMLPTVFARGTASGGDYLPATRVTINQFRRDYVAARTDGRVRLMDWGGADCELGDQALVDGANPNLQGDRIHLNATGDAVAAAFAKPVIEAARTAWGV